MGHQKVLETESLQGYNPAGPMESETHSHPKAIFKASL